MMEPLATGIEAAKKAQVKPGDTALVVGAGTIGIMVAISCLAAIKPLCKQETQGYFIFLQIMHSLQSFFASYREFLMIGR
jgi:hypothetical protein